MGNAKNQRISVHHEWALAEGGAARIFRFPGRNCAQEGSYFL